MIVNKLVLAAALALTFSSTVHARAIDLVTQADGRSSPPAVQAHPGSTADAARAGATVVLSSRISELPEPEVFAMMLVGLVLIGYRASRDSDEKFK
jgi:hypothetical protein